MASVLDHGIALIITAVESFMFGMTCTELNV